MADNVYPFPIDQVKSESHDAKKENKKGSGGGDMTGGQGIEARVARLESDVSHIQKDVTDIKSDLREIKRDMRDDFRITMGAMIAVALGLAGLMAKGFHWI